MSRQAPPRAESQQARSGGFEDRHAAGRELANALREINLDSPLVIALPRGGVPVAFEVARGLHAPLDIALVRKLGAPQQPELAVGAISEDGQTILDGQTIAALHINRDQLDAVIARERLELERRRDAYRAGADPLDVDGRNVILVDDGLATGSTAVAAARSLKGSGASRVLAAVPVCPQGVEQALAEEFDGILCLVKPRNFGGVGRWYRDFSPIPDAEVVDLLHRSREGWGRSSPPGEEADEHSGGSPAPTVESSVLVDVGSGIRLNGDLRIPARACGTVVFAHGSGSSRLSPRNRSVAETLNRAGFATLLLDLLSEDEERERANVFDLELLTDRLVAATAWTERREVIGGLPTGYFGASTGAAAALSAAARLPDRIGAVVSRGGRPDLAGNALAGVHAPTLLIVGGADPAVRQLNELASLKLAGERQIAVVPGAGHLFEEPGALADVADLAVDWFSAHLTGDGNAGSPRGGE